MGLSLCFSATHVCSVSLAFPKQRLKALSSFNLKVIEFSLSITVSMYLDETCDFNVYSYCYLIKLMTFHYKKLQGGLESGFSCEDHLLPLHRIRFCF